MWIQKELDLKMSLQVISLFFLLHVISTESYPFGFPLKSNESKYTGLSRITEKSVNYRLPLFIVPENYKITLTVYLDENPERRFTFDGAVEITLQIKKKVPKIILHSRQLEFTNNQVTLRRTNSNEVIDTIVDSDSERDFKYIKPLSSAKLLEGEYVLSINYTGVLNDIKIGFHKSSYENEKGEQIWLAATHLEPVSARNVFPCFDEPQLRATFDIIIRHRPDYNAISNMPTKTSKFIGSVKETIFHTTPSMSTYLVAFVVSNFKELYENPNFKVHVRPNAISKGELALKISEKLLRVLEDFTDIKYEISKLDQIAIPGRSGAMENWGLVTYGEHVFLYDEKTTSTAKKQNIVRTIAHELSHQWFGNLVTPKWWKFLWLKEGFASFFQYYITEKVNPEWQLIYQSVVQDIQTDTFDTDSSLYAHPLDQDVESPDEIKNIFDTISYNKGGAIIRMMQHFLGNDIFRRGLNVYLTDNEFDVAESSDLFRAFDKALTEYNVHFEHRLKTIMDSWVNCKGYPVVTVTRNYKNPEVLQIKQKRFVSYDATEEEVNKCHWHIPINYATKTNPIFDNTTATSWLIEASETLSTKLKPHEWIILNKQQSGYYRVNYDEKNWQLIINHLNTDRRHEIHVLNRAQLMNDALAFTKQGNLKLSILLRLTSYLTNETDYVAWYPAIKTYSWLKTKLISTEHYTFFKEYIVNTSRKLVESVGLEESIGDGHIDKLKRIGAIQLACSNGDISCAKFMENKLEKWLNEPDKTLISPDYESIMLCEGLRVSTLKLWKKAFFQCLNSTDVLKRNLKSALGCSNNKEILEYYLNYTVEENSLLTETFIVVEYILNNSDIGIDSVLNFIIKRHATLLSKYNDELTLTYFFENVGRYIRTKRQLEKLKATKELNIPESVTRPGIDLAVKNLQWLEQYEQAVITWIKEVKAKN